MDPPTNMELAPAALVDTLLKHHWVTTQSKAFSRKEHINLLELEMVKQELKDRVNGGRGHCRVVNLCDSRVVVGAYAKGRSSSKQMNHRLRSSLPWSLAGDISLCNLWVSTDCNPADHPSRNKPIPPPKPAVHPDPLLDPQLLRGAQSFRPVCV